MRPLILLPARNEVASLPSVVREVCRLFPAGDVLIIDDASDDGTARLLPQLGVCWIRLPEQTGVGGAVRRGLQYALDRGYDAVVRVDADGQHVASGALELLETLVQSGAHAVVGSRYKAAHGYRSSRVRRAAQRVLELGLSLRLRSRVTDPTSGFWAFGPRAVELLAAHHPGGYSEPQLRLLLHRSGFRVQEVGVAMRHRLAGRTTLTPVRAVIAFARACCAVVSQTPAVGVVDFGPGPG